MLFARGETRAFDCMWALTTQKTGFITWIPMKILVTGAAGFLGSHLCEKLKILGHDIVGIDNMIGGYRDNVSKNIKFLDKKLLGHYTLSPFTYKPKIGKKFIFNSNIDFEKGLLGLVKILKKKRLNK